MGGLPPSLLPSLSFWGGGAYMCNMVGGWCRWGPSVTRNHACPHTESRFLINDILTTQCVAWWESKMFAKREVRAMLVNHPQKVQECYFQLATLGGKKRRRSEGLFLTTLCKCLLQPSCHSRSAKWITLKVREKCLARLSNSSSPKPICLPVTVVLGD